jgi:hypothetical protein
VAVNMRSRRAASADPHLALCRCIQLANLNCNSKRMQVGRLWTSLADFFIRQALFEKARDVYEEGLTTVSRCCPA